MRNTPSNPPLAVFRCDASANIGSGHVVRCLTLADALSMQGWQCAFLCAAGSEQTVPRLSDGIHHFVSLPSDQDSHDIARSHWPDGANLLIVDSYRLDATFETACRPWAKRILVIDDLADRPHDCDILLDQNLQSAPTRYAKWIPTSATCLIGPRFSLLRSGFAQHRAQLTPRDGSIQRILIFTGGTDPDNFTATLLGAVSRFSKLTVDIVMGRASPHLDEIATLCHKLPNCHLHIQTTRMDELLAKADLVLGSGGGNTWERCALGVPTIMAAIAANQRDNGNMLARQRAGIFLGEAAEVNEQTVVDLLQRLLMRPSLVRRMSQRALALTDGLGATRVAALLAQSADTGDCSLFLRPAHLLDRAFAFSLRNDPKVYAYFFNPTTVDWDSHCAWFSRTIENTQQRLLIVENLSDHIGVLRLDLQDNEAEISVSLHPTYQGKGLGTHSLLRAAEWARHHLPHLQRLVARIQDENAASKKAFERAGFYKREKVYVFDLSVKRP